MRSLQESIARPGSALHLAVDAMDDAKNEHVECLDESFRTSIKDSDTSPQHDVFPDKRTRIKETAVKRRQRRQRAEMRTFSHRVKAATTVAVHHTACSRSLASSDSTWPTKEAGNQWQRGSESVG